MEADKLLVADRLVGLEETGRALDAGAVAVAVCPAPVVLATRPGAAQLVAAVPGAAGALAGGAHRPRPPLEGARPLRRGELGPLRPAAVLRAVVVPAAVALLALLHHSITANGNFRL